VRLIPLVVLFGLFVRWLVLLVTTEIATYPPEVIAINCRMIGTWMLWAFLLQELFKLLLRRCLLASQGTVHSHDEIVWLALSGWTRVVPLAFIGTVVVWMPRVAIIAPRELLPYLFLLLGPVVHHVMKPCNSSRSVLPKLSIDAWVGDAVVEAVDDVFLQDIRNGGADIEETTCIGP
jgi:hypothetical protein